MNQLPKTIQAGIVGGAGYTGGEMIRLLLGHPHVEIAFVNSKSQAGRPISDIHQDLVGETDLRFSQEVSKEIDVLFVCAGHGKTRPFLESHDLPDSLKVIDLSRDFRLVSPEHSFVYGLPELNREAIKTCDFLANPGCFATCLQLGLLPLAQEQMIQQDVHVHAITGSTGAGQKPLATTHFSWRNNNLSIYKAFRHQHLDEIYQSLRQLQAGLKQEINFLPMRGDFSRGIFASMYLQTPIGEAEAISLYEQYYKDHPFTWLSSTQPHLKQVVNTNKCLIHVEKHDDKLLIISMIDNLLKGASGQAIQNMNLMFGLPETAGLMLKAAAF
ncbi:MAG: N-acetyl-gamma-glutamyl-phosphate reductase [Bacteroidota bacterium]